MEKRLVTDDSSAARILQLEAARDADGIVVRRRRFAYVTTFVVLFFAYFYLRDSTWLGSSQLHTLMETVATVLSLAVGSLALVRYYSKTENNFLFIGTAFVATAFLDGYHAVVSSSRFIALFPSTPPSLIAWSWFASRFFLSLLLWLSWLFWRRQDRLGATGLISEKLAYGIVTALALACFAVVAFVPMPAAYYQQLPFPRPQEFVPALFFLLALIGYLRKGKWKADVFEHCLVLSLIVGFMGQAMFMSFSGRVFDMMFDAAHLLKNGSYICVMVGLLFSMKRLFSESYAQQELAFTNTLLVAQQEVSPDAILVVDEQGKIISYNRHFVELWGLKGEMVAARVDAPVLQSVAAQVQDLDTFLTRVKYLYEHRSEYGHDEILLKDGRILDRNSAPIIGENGRYYGRIWFFRDITGRKRTEQTAKDERNFSNTLIRSLPDIFFLVDHDGSLLRWNKQFEVLLGLSPEEVLGINVLSINHVDDRPHAIQAVQQAFETGSASLEARLVLPKGVRNYLLTATRIETKLGVNLIGFGTDITERIRAEEILRRSDAHLAEAQRISHVGSWELDHVTGEGRWSAEAFRIFEHDPASFVPNFEGFLATVHPDDRDMLKETFGRSLQEHTPYNIEHRLLMKDGRIKYAREQCQTSFDELGRPLLTVGTVQDITDRVLSEHQIKLFRSLLDSAPDEILVLDPVTLRIIDVNESACVKLGYTRKELLAMRALDIDTSDSERNRRIGERLLRDGATTFETYHKRKDGSTFPVEVMIRIVTLGQPYALAMARDITERKQAQAELLESELAYRTLSQNLPGMVYRVFVRESGRMQFFNAMPVLMTGYAEDELTTGAVCSIEPLILDADRPGVEAEVMRAIAGKRAFAVEYRLKRKDGGIRWMAEHGMPVYGTDGAPLYIDGVIFDLTEHKQAEMELQLFRTLVDNSSDSIEVLDPATLRFLDVNETQCRELGYSREELLSMKLTDIDPGLNADLLKVIEEQTRETGSAQFETIHRRKDGSTFPVEVSAKLVELDKPYALNIVRDITERKLADAEVQQLQGQLREQALHDPLTGLHNRRYLDEAIGRELIRSARNKQPIGIVMCDLDHFKLVNDTYGHLVGDEILRVFAELLKKHARGSDIVCRFGGEEFVLFLPDMPPAVAYQRAEQLRTSLAALQIGKEGIRVTASFGVAAFPENGKTMDSLIGAVDAAMYRAKEAGRNRVVVASAHEEDVSGRT